MKLFNKAKNVIRAWLDITPAQKNIYYLNETFNFESNAIKNRIWMRGDPEELDEFYKQLERQFILLGSEPPYKDTQDSFRSSFVDGAGPY